MKYSQLIAVIGVVGLCVGCGSDDKTSPTAAAPNSEPETFAEARAGFTTKLTEQESDGTPPDEPPEGMFELVHYPGPLGEMAAYVTPDFGDGQKHRAIIWLTGGFSNGIGDSAWAPFDASNDQSAQQYRQEGLVMMFPTRRGGNDSPGHVETFYGEVDDVIAATKWLKSLNYVDPERIYLGGHSTGGTLALLVAECSDEYRGVISFGPVEDVRGYGPDYLTFDMYDEEEAKMRAPVHWLHCIKCPTYIFEGSDGNADSLAVLNAASTNPLIVAKVADGYDHFSILAPTNRMIAKQLVEDEGERLELKFGGE